MVALDRFWAREPSNFVGHSGCELRVFRYGSRALIAPAATSVVPRCRRFVRHAPQASIFLFLPPRCPRKKKLLPYGGIISMLLSLSPAAAAPPFLLPLWINSFSCLTFMDRKSLPLLSLCVLLLKTGLFVPILLLPPFLVSLWTTVPAYHFAWAGSRVLSVP